MSKKLIVVLVGLLFCSILASCMPSFTHPTKSDEDRERDIRRCQNKAMRYYKRGYGNPTGELRSPGEHTANTRERFHECMEDLGWTRTD